MLNDLYIPVLSAGTSHWFHHLSQILTFLLYPWPSFSTPVIWNNLRASLESIQQSWEEQRLTLIKIYMCICACVRVYTHTHTICALQGSERQWDRKGKEGLQMKQALLSPSCPPSSKPFQLKSAVVIKFQQGLGATVWHTDGGLPWHKDDTIQEDRGGQAEKGGRVTNVVFSRTLPDSYSSIFMTFKEWKMKWIFRFKQISQWPFAQIRDILNRSIFCICGICRIFSDA